MRRVSVRLPSTADVGSASSSEFVSDSSDDGLRWSPRQRRSPSASAGRCSSSHQTLRRPSTASGPRGPSAVPTSYSGTTLMSMPPRRKASSASRASARVTPLVHAEREGLLHPRRRSSRASTNAVRTVTADAYLSTLDARKQQKLIALFYWRRRALETHFAAWRWVVSAVLRPTKLEMQREMELLHAYNRVRHPPRRGSQNAILEGTLRRRERASAHRESPSAPLMNSGSVGQSPSPVLPVQHEISPARDFNERMRSIRDEYRALKAKDLVQPASPPRQSSGPTNIAKASADELCESDKALGSLTDPKRDYRVRLCTLYQHFDAWRGLIELVQQERSRKWELAERWHHINLLTHGVRVWRSFCRSRNLRYERQRKGIQHFEKTLVRTSFRRWMGEMILSRRAKVVRMRSVRQRAHECFRWWQRCLVLLHATQEIVAKRERHLELTHLHRWRDFIHSRHHKRVQRLEIASTYNRKVLLRAIRCWRESVLCTETRLQVNVCYCRGALRKGIRRWRTFIGKRREASQAVLHADYFCYELLQRRWFESWCEYHERKRTKRLVIADAACSYHKRKMHKGLRALQACCRERVFERERQAGADQWHKLHLGRRYFTSWRAAIQKNRTALRYMVVKARQRYVRAFILWKSWTRQTNRIRFSGMVVAEDHQIRIKRNFLNAWCQMWRLYSRLHSVKYHQRHRAIAWFFRRWATISIDSRNARKIGRLLFEKRQQCLLRDVLVEWRHIARRRRCYRRLIRLFRKKTGRKLLISSFRRIRVNAVATRLWRGRQSRVLLLVMMNWEVYTTRRRAKRNTIDAAIRSWTTRHQQLAVCRWRACARDLIQERRNNHNALRHLITRILHGAFLGWRRIAREYRLRDEFLSRLKLHRCIAMQRRAVRVWHNWAKRRRQVHRRLNALELAMRTRTLSGGFHAWCQYRIDRIHRAQQLRRGDVVFERKLYNLVLHAWRDEINIRRTHRSISYSVQARHAARVTRTAFHLWHQNAFTERRERVALNRAVAFHNEYLLLSAFLAWQSRTLEELVLTAKIQKVREFVQLQHRRRSVHVWRIECQRRRAIQNQRDCGDQFFRQRHLARSLCQLSRNAQRRQRSKKLHHTSVEFARRRLTQSAFDAWTTFMSKTRAVKQRLRTIFQTGDDYILRQALRCWRRYKRTRGLTLRAEAFRRVALLRLVWRHWCGHVAFVSTMNRNVLVTSRLLQNNATKATFYRWRIFAERRRRHRALVSRCDSHHIRSQYIRTIACFRHLVLQCAIERRAREGFARRLLTTHFTRWRQFSTKLKLRKCQNASARAHAQQQRKKTAFRHWRMHITLFQQRQAALVDGHNARSTLRRFWKVWWHQVKLHRIVLQLLDSRHQRLVHSCFRTWNAFRRKESQRKKQVAAAVRHINGVRLEKMWQRWLMYMDAVSTRHRRLSLALSFYSTEILQRRCLQQWRVFVDHCREERERMLRATGWYMFTSARKAWIGWEQYIEHRRRRSTQALGEDMRIQAHVTARALQKWQNRARQLRQLHASATKGICHHRIKRLQGAINCISHYVSIRKQNKQKTTQAQGHHAKAALQRSFGVWRSYRVWRARNKHLIRLFRSNQKSDYFKMWRLYLTTRAHKLEQKKLADNYNVRHQYQRTFFQWGAFAQSRRQKRIASSFYRRRQLQLCFALWSRRARILRHLRKMFLYQETFRLENHFNAWKRVWTSRKKQINRLKAATGFFDRNRITKCWASWWRWIDKKQLEKQTLLMAIGFRQRFFSLKYLSGWRTAVRWCRRKRSLIRVCDKHFRATVQKKVLSAWQQRRLSTLQLRCREELASEWLSSILLKRGIDRLLSLVRERRHRRAREQIADRHRDQVLTKRCWWGFRHFVTLNRALKARIGWALGHRELHLQRQVLVTWHQHTRRFLTLRQRVRRFRAKYFQSVVEKCFSRWNAMVLQRHRLQWLRVRADRRRRHWALGAWRHLTRVRNTRREVLAGARERRRMRVLRRCLTHWERVTTDQWMYANLVGLHHAHRRRQLRGRVVACWRRFVATGRARRCFLRRRRERHAAALRQILGAWQRAVCVAVDGGHPIDMLDDDGGIDH